MSALASHDYVIADFDLEQLPGADEITRHADIGLGGLLLPAWVVMHDHNGGSRRQDCHSEDRGSRNENGVERSYRNQMMAFDLPPGIEQQDHQTLAIWVKVRMTCNMRFPILCRLFRPFTDLHLLGCGTFPK